MQEPNLETQSQSRSAIWHIAENSLSELFIEDVGVNIKCSQNQEWFSATDLFQASGKQVAKYLKAEGTKRFYAKLAVKLGVTPDDLLSVNKGGSGIQGTWVHKRALMHVLAECSDEIKVWFFGEIGFELLSGNDIKHSDAMQSLQDTARLLSQSEANALVQQYETRLNELELLTDEMATDLALKEHQLNQMKYFVEEVDVMGRWQQENSFGGADN